VGSIREVDCDKEDASEVTALPTIQIRIRLSPTGQVALAPHPFPTGLSR